MAAACAGASVGGASSDDVTEKVTGNDTKKFKPAVRFTFCGKPKGHTPIFVPSPQANTASVNAGDYLLYVGGGAINRAFKQELKLGRDNGFQRLHEAALVAAAAKPGELVAVPQVALNTDLQLLNCFARVYCDAGTAGDGSVRKRVAQPDPVGAVFLDIFAPDHRPLSEKNVAMVYVVGPKGVGARGGHGPTVASADAFLKSVQELGANAIAAVGEYNSRFALQGSGLPRIEVMQWCLVSGGVYRHPSVSKADVARATVDGMLSGGLEAGASAPEVRFAYDEHAFEDAVGDVLGEARL